MHSRQLRKSKGKLSARDKQLAEENEKNLEDQFSKDGDVGNCVLGRQQEDGASEEMKGPMQEVREEEMAPASHLGGGPAECGAVQNGPARFSRVPVVPGHSNPGEDAGNGGAEEVVGEPAPAEEN